jgi:hypothetical protein
MDEQIKNTYICTGFAFPGMWNKELNNITKEISLQ